MKLEVGKLYVCEEYFLMFYPDQETALHGGLDLEEALLLDEALPCGPAHASAAVAAHFAAFWSQRFGKPVLFSEKNIPLLVLNSKDNCVEVLAGERKGWIIFRDWLNIKEIM